MHYVSVSDDCIFHQGQWYQHIGRLHCGKIQQVIHISQPVSIDSAYDNVIGKPYETFSNIGRHYDWQC